MFKDRQEGCADLMQLHQKAHRHASKALLRTNTSRPSSFKVEALAASAFHQLDEIVIVGMPCRSKHVMISN
jgi:hypothetical protein